ncbi:MAG: T9SS type A sorting domain-containing protein [Ignavibacteriales bacterium]|nr:T9SS type A sorting domain-containing protein [Ignavibacteriales bacterium]
MGVLETTVFLSTDNGASWTHQGLVAIGVNILAVNGTHLFAGTNSAGVWRRPLSEMITGVNDQTTSPPFQFVLEQNYPNPFNPSTKIRFAVPGLSFVLLKVYNLLGQEVATLVNEEKRAGSYEVQWNAIGFSSGIYFYKLRSGNFVETKRMLMIK